MKKILVPVDFSECSYHAAEVAAQIAKKLMRAYTSCISWIFQFMIEMTPFNPIQIPLRGFSG